MVIRSHFVHLIVFSTIVSVFFAVMLRRDRKEQIRLGGYLWLAMVGGALALAFLMVPFPD
jgi:hypothetical protein